MVTVRRTLVVPMRAEGGSMSVDLLDAGMAIARRVPNFRGKGKLAHKVADWCAASGEWDIRMRGDHRVVLPRSSRQSWFVAITGTYDEQLVRLALDHVQPGSTVLDIGASLGLWTVQLALRTRAERVIAFEPVAANCDVIRKNVALNHLDGRVMLENCALGAETGSVVMHVEAGGVGNAAADVAGSGTEAGVPMRTLDSFEIPGKCSFVKMDVEGFEMNVLAGASRFIRTHRPVIIGEFSPQWFKNRGVPADAVERWADANGYAVIGLRLIHRRWYAAPSLERVAASEVDPKPGSVDDVLLCPLDRDGRV